MAEALAAAGADVVGVSASLDPAGSAVGEAVEAAGRRFTGYAADFSDRAAVRAFAATVLADHTVDILVNNAGTIRRAPAEAHTDADWDHVIEVNLSAQFVLTREIGGAMLARGRGKVIFIASVLSFQGGITVPGYAAAKGGLASLTKAFANEWAGRGVNVNAIAPGYIETDNTAPIRADPERHDALLVRIPAARFGRPEDLGGPVVFLASDASDYMHGAVMAVDGGWLGR